MLRVGLCATCVRARRIQSGKGSLFYLCEAASSDSRLKKYPPLPVRSCPAFIAQTMPRVSDEPEDG